jgi:hypothetical protein
MQINKSWDFQVSLIETAKIVSAFTLHKQIIITPFGKMLFIVGGI